MKQRTLKNSVQVTGLGLHNGQPVYVTLNPAPENTGIVFRRIDLNFAEIPATVDNVVDTTFCTSLASTKNPAARVNTVEHFLSAIAGLGIDNLYIDLNASEVPIMDGSSAPFIFLMQSAGIHEQDAPKRFMRIKKVIEAQEQDKFARLEPYDGFLVRFKIDYNHPAFSKSLEEVAIDFSKNSYTREISRARTYGFLSEYDMLRSHNLALGGSLDNAVVVDDTRVLNEDGLRYPDEFVRHKILDAVGDLYLLGCGIVGAFVAYKSGHGLNNRLIRALLSDQSAWEYVYPAEQLLSSLSYIDRFGEEVGATMAGG